LYVSAVDSDTVSPITTTMNEYRPHSTRVTNDLHPQTETTHAGIYVRSTHVFEVFNL